MSYHFLSKINREEVSSYADLIVVSEDYMTCPVNKIKNMQVEMTMLGGKIVNNGN